MHYYTIIKSSNIGEMMARVQEYMNDGWQLQGGVCVYTKQSGRYSATTNYFYAQALTKEE